MIVIVASPLVGPTRGAGMTAEAVKEFPKPRNMVEPRALSCVVIGTNCAVGVRSIHPHSQYSEANSMVITAAHIQPVVAILAGSLILIMPRLLSFIVAIYLIFIGLVELNAIHHFIR
jgi:hypothetical protein